MRKSVGAESGSDEGGGHSAWEPEGVKVMGEGGAREPEGGAIGKNGALHRVRPMWAWPKGCVGLKVGGRGQDAVRERA